MTDHFVNFATFEDAKAILSGWGLWATREATDRLPAVDEPRGTTAFPDEALEVGPNQFAGAIVTILWLETWQKQIGSEIDADTGMTVPIYEQQPGCYALIRITGKEVPLPDPLPKGMVSMALKESPIEFMGGNVGPAGGGEPPKASRSDEKGIKPSHDTVRPAQRKSDRDEPRRPGRGKPLGPSRPKDRE